jgi:putative transposase
MAMQLIRLNGRCLGFVVMPDHVHGMVWFATAGQINEFMKQWKRTSSYRMKKQLREIPSYASFLDRDEPIWQPRYYDFNIKSSAKIQEKIDYMHKNPVRAGLVEKAEDWLDSSARHDLLGEPSAIPIGFE